MVKAKTKTNKLVKIALLSAIAFIIMLFEFIIPFMPTFLKLDFSDIPAIVAAFSLGPLAGIICELIKNLLFLIIRGTQSSFVGELANFIIGSSLCLTCGLIYNRNKTKKTAIISLIVGIFAMSIVGCLVNYYILLPFYMNLYGFDSIIKSSQAVNPNINNLFTLILYAILPFNLIKGIIISLITTIIYKSISKVL